MKKFHWIIVLSSVVAAITAVFATLVLTAGRTKKNLSDVTVDDEPETLPEADTETADA